MIKINWIIFFIIISWFIVGFIGMISVHLSDMRGEEFNENFFDKECVFISFALVLLGYLVPIILLFDWCKEHKPFTKLLYKIANIGIDKNK